MDELATYWLEYGLVIAGLVVCACLVVGVAALILRRGTAPKPVPAPEHWMGFEQRRFSYPGRSLRVMATVLISVVLVGGVMVGPVALGVASDVSWYVRVDWIIALFVAITVSGGAYYLFLGTDRPRCPSCSPPRWRRARPSTDAVLTACGAFISADRAKSSGRRCTSSHLNVGR